MPIGFGNLIGLFALASLLPFIVLYFVRPKPREIVIPSIIFLSGTREFISKSSFFRRVLSDKILLLEIIILGLISLFFSAPFLATENVRSGEVVLVMDTSASIGNGDIFENVKEETINNLGGKNTLITVGNNPYLIFESFDKTDAEKEIKKVRPTDTRSSIAESIAAAKKILDKISGERALVVVSDFADSEGGDVKKELNAVKAAGIPLRVSNVAGKEVENVGIVELSLGKIQSEAIIKNYCCETRDVVINYNGKGGKATIINGQSESYKFETAEGKSTLKIDVNDDIDSDNEVFIINEKDERAEVLLISDKENKFLEAAMTATDELSFDSVTSDKPKSGYDVYIVQNIVQDSLKLTEFLEGELKNGKSVVIIPEAITGDYRGLLDFNIGSNIPGGEAVVASEAGFVDGIQFGRQSNVKQIDCNGECEGVYVSAGDEPLIMIRPKYTGLLAYYGLIDEAGFQNRPDYPIFWTRFVKHLGHVRDLSSMNLRTGSVISFADEVQFITPSGFRGTDKSILLEEKGFYEIEGRTYSANLISEEEADFTNNNLTTDDAGAVSTLQQDYIINKNLWKWLILVACILLIVEWILINRKMRRQKYNV